jgi:eukaryotic-like serine/threonine-protein kinase
MGQYALFKAVRCAKCGAAVASRRTRKLCPSCALESALKGEAEAVVTGGSAPAEAGSINALSAAAMAGQRFGDYELLEEISRGGMGVVFRARQVSLDRLVAIKMLLFGPLASTEVVQRFRTEAAAAASLQHPNIVAIHEVGIHEKQHFFVMDYVAGRSLADIVRDGPLEPKRAAHYVKKIAEAIHYAHDKGILHRDLKPSNVLIDEDDQPRVTDFGLAKRLEKETELTLSGQVLGSPSYMPPEQAAAHRGVVGKRSDVYSLGAILYHLLTGRAPFVASSVAETLAQVQTADPVSPTILNPHLPGDLKTICLRCLEKEPGRRYQTAQELGQDLGHFLNGETIMARSVGPAGKTWRWCQRKPVVAALSAAVVMVFLLGFAGVAWQAQRATQARDLAQGRLYAAQMKLAHGAIREGKTGGSLAMLRTLEPRAGERDFRGFDWRYLYGLCLDSPSEVLATNAFGFKSVDFSPDGRKVAVGTVDGWVEVFDAGTRQRVQRWRAHEDSVDLLSFYPRNNDWLATLSGQGKPKLKFWDIKQQELLFSLPAARGLQVAFAFSPGGSFLATQATNARSIILWKFSPDTPDVKRTLTLSTNYDQAAFSPDESSLALCSGNLVCLYDLADGSLTSLPRAHVLGPLYAVAFSPDGRRVATGGVDARIALWDVRARTNIWVERSPLRFINAIVFSPDGRHLFASGDDQNICSWNLENPGPAQSWTGHGASVHRLAIAPDGSSLASASDDGTVRIWPLSSLEPTSSHLPPQPFKMLFSPRDVPWRKPENVAIYGVAVSPAQDRAAASGNPKLLLYDLTSGTLLNSVGAAEVFSPKPSALVALSFSPDGRQLAVASEDGRVVFLDATSLRRLREPFQIHANQITHMAYALNGSVLVTGGGFGNGIILTDVATGLIRAEFGGNEGVAPLQPLAVSQDGKYLATGSPEGGVEVRDIVSLRVVASSPVKVSPVVYLAFSPDGKRLAIGAHRKTFLWDLTGEKRWRRLAGGGGEVAFSPDGRTLATADWDHNIRLWHPDIEQDVAVLTGHTDLIWDLAFGAQGNALLSGSGDGTLRLWRAPSFKEIEIHGGSPTAPTRGR